MFVNYGDGVFVEYVMRIVFESADCSMYSDDFQNDWNVVRNLRPCMQFASNDRIS